MIKKFTGVVTEMENPYRPLVGGVDVIKELWGYDWKREVTVVIANEWWSGDLDMDLGCEGYSELTPGWPARLMVGPNNIKNMLPDRYMGQNITIWIADEPINVLEE